MEFIQNSIYDGIHELVSNKDPLFLRYKSSIVDALKPMMLQLELSIPTDEQGSLSKLLSDIKLIRALAEPKGKAPRSWVVLAIQNILFEFGHIVDLESALYAPLHHILDDLNGSHKMTDIQFFCDLRTTFDRHIGTNRAARDLDEFIANTIFFLKLPRWGVTIPNLVTWETKFSSKAISRFYLDTKWSVLGSISICSRVALRYHVNEIQRFEEQHQEFYIPREDHIRNVGKGPEFTELLRPFAEKLPEHVKDICMMKSCVPEMSMQMLRNAMDKNELYNFKTNSETQGGSDETAFMLKKMRSHVLDKKRKPKSSVLMDIAIRTQTLNSAWSDTINTLQYSTPIVLRIQVSNVINDQKICFRPQAWLHPDRGRDCLGDDNELFFLAGLQISCIWTSRPLPTKDEDDGATFKDKRIIIECEFTDNIHDVVQKIPKSGVFLWKGEGYNDNFSLHPDARLVQKISTEILFALH
jgi:hypothetical protein